MSLVHALGELGYEPVQEPAFLEDLLWVCALEELPDLLAVILKSPTVEGKVELLCL